MKKYLVAAILIAAIVLTTGVQAAPAPKVQICHIPPGNPGNAHTIEVSANALAAHIGPRGHALDYLGPCEAPAQPITCEQAVGGGLLTGEIANDTGLAVVQNLANQSFNVSLASYEMWSNNTFDQQLYDNESKVVGANSNTSFGIDIPQCAYQIDLICGSPISPPDYGPFQVIDSEFGNENLFCSPTSGVSGPGVNATLNIQASFPQGTNYSFSCDATGFTPTLYHWYFGDGSFLFNQSANTVFHTYSPGVYLAACTATDGTNTATDTLPIVAVS